MAFGVTATGFSIKTITDILSEIEAQQKTDFGSDFDTSAESVAGQLNAVYGGQVSEGWEVLHAVYRSLYPDSATGEALDNVCAITGTTREQATKSTMAVTCTGEVGTLIPTGRVVSTSAGDRFVSLADATIPGTGTVDVGFEAEEYGPIVAQTQTLTIETPVSGWDTATNAADATVGQDLESDASLRLRRLAELRAQGAATIEAIIADLLQVDGVEQVILYENVSEVTDGRGLPPKSIEAIVLHPDELEQPGIETDVAEALFATKPAGILTYGETGQKVAKTVTDSQGIDHTIEYTRPDELEVYVEVDIDINAATYAGDDAVRDAILAYGATLQAGDTVVYEKVQASFAFVSGVVDITDTQVGLSSPASGTSNLTATDRQQYVFGSARIVVNTNAV